MAERTRFNNIFGASNNKIFFIELDFILRNKLYKYQKTDFIKNLIYLQSLSDKEFETGKLV